MKKNKIKILIISFISLSIFSGFFFVKSDKFFEIAKNIDLFSKVYKEVALNYVEDINPEQFIRAGIKGMLGSLDPYTVFIDGNKKSDFDLLTKGKYGGVGVSIGLRGNRVTILEVIDGYSSQRQGIRVGDVLLEAGGVKITPKNMENISSLVKGKPGTTVDIKVLRNGIKDTLDFNLVREEVIVNSLIYGGFYPRNSNNVYLKLSNFGRSGSYEIRSRLEELNKEKEIKSIVLDLRGNPGGLLNVAVNISDDLLPKGVLIVSTLGRDNTNEKKFFSKHNPLFPNAKIVVLINRGSASASEIVTGALQDHDKAVIVGTKSFGKGLVQTITPLDYNTSVKITTAKYYTPSGRSIQRINYSKTKVIAKSNSIKKDSFETDNKRIVYSGGGINPDTLVKYNMFSEVFRAIYSRGLFFSFADNFYYKQPKKSFSKLNNKVVFSSFKKYLKQEKFSYIPYKEKELNKLIDNLSSNKSYNVVRNKLLNVRIDLKNLHKAELEINKDNIINQIKSELASRYINDNARIEVLLNRDRQFQTSLLILKDNKIYHKILHSKY